MECRIEMAVLGCTGRKRRREEEEEEEAVDEEEEGEPEDR